MKEAPARLVARKIHREIRETEADNVGVESAHKSEEVVETGVHLVREGYRSHKLKPYRKAADAFILELCEIKYHFTSYIITLS